MKTTENRPLPDKQPSIAISVEVWMSEPDFGGPTRTTLARIVDETVLRDARLSTLGGRHAPPAAAREEVSIIHPEQAAYAES
jgi:hypothetical protein